ncbi:hypothetical protein SUGI_1031000 [Cryptomeria japonica]|nr:hypothetical protein SUGI_1031000 [Cryptomeria japonica]
MSAEVVSNGDMQFQNNFNNQRFECTLDEATLNSDNIDFASFVGHEEEELPLQLPPLQSVKSDDIENKLFEGNIIEANNMDDIFNVDMFDFGMDEQASFAMLGNGDNSEQCNQDGGVLTNSPPKSTDNFNEEDKNGCPPSSALVPANPFDQLPQGLLRSDSDGLTDLEDQLMQQPTLDQNGIPASTGTTFPMDGVDISQNPFYNDIHFNWPQLNEMQCGSCQCFRQIIHSNGIQDTKLEIHGRNGQFYHAIMHTRSMSGIPSNVEPQIIEFAMANTDYVKQFLFQYSLLRRREGFILHYDSLCPYHDPIYFNQHSASGFYNQPLQQPYLNPYDLASGFQAPSNGFIPGQNLTGQFWMDRRYAPHGVDQTGSTPPVKPPKSNVALQRERTGKLKISDLAAYFHLPINVAAKELAICPTVLKKICRRNGMRRWPHRKIKSIERIITTLEQSIADGNGEGVESIRAEIAMLKNEKAQLCAGLLGENK